MREWSVATPTAPHAPRVVLPRAGLRPTPPRTALSAALATSRVAQVTALSAAVVACGCACTHVHVSLRVALLTYCTAAVRTWLIVVLFPFQPLKLSNASPSPTYKLNQHFCAPQWAVCGVTRPNLPSTRLHAAWLSCGWRAEAPVAARALSPG